jgi:tetratricopeptide (TPR) repeat protein
MKQQHNSTICLLLVGVFTLALTSCGQPSNSTLLERGNYAMWQGRWSDAATSFQKATLQHPGDWRAQYHLGQCYLEMGDATRASQSLAVAESLRPADTEIAALYAESLLLSNEQDKLYTFLLHRAQKQQTTDDWITFAEYTMDLDDPDSAVNAINTAIAISDGTTAEPYIVAASFAERLGDDPLAVTRWSEAWVIEPTNETISNALRAHGVVPGPTMTGVDDGKE